jgi:PhnB protein
MARVSTYLNFSRNTEEVFNYYKSIFGGEFSGGGVARFRDIPLSDDMPPFPEADKDLIMHIELPLPGGHIIMGTDAPESLGFKVTFGNNIHINLEHDTKAETKRLFEALSSGGEITMELQVMFWGAYYGTCTDKYGIQWMFNCTEK